jgi:hypothetical protein
MPMPLSRHVKSQSAPSARTEILTTGGTSGRRSLMAFPIRFRSAVVRSAE